MVHFKNLAGLHHACGMPPPEYPMLSLFSFDKPPDLFPENVTAYTGDFFQIALKRIRTGMVLYGRTKYDHNNGIMSFIKPGQIVELKNLQFEEKGFVISFHEDFIKGHSLYHEI